LVIDTVCSIMVSLSSCLIAFKPRDIGYILGPSDSLLVPYEMRAPDYPNRQSLDLDDLTIGPRLVELHSIDRGQNIDTAWGNADLKDEVERFQVISCQPRKGSAEALQRSPDSCRILLRTPNPDVHIPCRSWKAMGRQSIGPHKQKFSVFVAQGGQHVAEVGIQQGSPP
jgi:hypothetical protein